MSSPRRGDLNELGVMFDRDGHVRRNFCLEAVTIQALVVGGFREEQLVGSSSLPTAVTASGIGNQSGVGPVKRSRLEVEQQIRFDPQPQFRRWDEDFRLAAGHPRGVERRLECFVLLRRQPGFANVPEHIVAEPSAVTRAKPVLVPARDCFDLYGPFTQSVQRSWLGGRDTDKHSPVCRHGDHGRILFVRSPHLRCMTGNRHLNRDTCFSAGFRRLRSRLG